MTSTTAELRKMVKVDLPPDAAFRLFTEGIGAWWPLDTHSVGRDQASSVEFEPHVAGRIIETMRSGDRVVWGTVRVWEPPTRVTFTWHPGTSDSEATDVAVSFRADAHGTLVELVHTGWDRRTDGDKIRDNYASGWDLVLGHYADGVNGRPEPTPT